MSKRLDSEDEKRASRIRLNPLKLFVHYRDISKQKPKKIKED